jgi:2-methylisocitrate lyase-like PEP mutase family enzyme
MKHQSRVSRRKFVQQAIATGGALATFDGAAPAHAAGQVGAQTPVRSPGQRLRQLLQGPDVLQCPVIYDMVSLKLAAHLGFPAAFAGGSPISASMYGMGDFGWLTMTELIEFSARAAEATDMLVMGDGDDGGGNPLNVHRTIRRFERAGVAAVMLEDMYGAKHLPGLPEGPLSPIPAFADKLKAAVDARKLDLVLVARTDAMSVGESFDKAVERVAAYAEAGADVVFVAGATVQQSLAVANATNRPVMCIVPVDRPEAALDVVRQSRVKMAVYSGQLLGVAARAVRDALVQLKQTGQMTDLRERTLPREDFSAITGTGQAVEVARRFNAGRIASF